MRRIHTGHWQLCVLCWRCVPRNTVPDCSSFDVFICLFIHFYFSFAHRYRHHLDSRRINWPGCGDVIIQIYRRIVDHSLLVCLFINFTVLAIDLGSPSATALRHRCAHGSIFVIESREIPSIRIHAPHDLCVIISFLVGRVYCRF